MKIALQKAIPLLRRHPVLWRPIIVSAALSWGITAPLLMLTHRIEIALVTRR